VTSSLFVSQVLSGYTALPDTPSRPSRHDRAVARDLYHRDVRLDSVRHAFLLASVRRHYRDPSLGPLDSIRSLSYFLPVIRQLELQPLDPFYVDYLERKLADIPCPAERSTP